MRISDWSSDVCSSDLLADSRLRYDDAVQDRHLDAAIAADAQGLRLTGKGSIRGAPVSVSARGPAVSSAGRWPFAAAIDGTALAMTAKGTMARALDTGQKIGRASCRGRVFQNV